MNNSIKHLECNFVKSSKLNHNESNIYTRYVSDLESEIRLLADLTMIVEMKMERINDKYCAYE